MSPDRVLLVAAMLSGVVLLISLAGGILLREARRRELEGRMLTVVSGLAPVGGSVAGATGAAGAGLTGSLIQLGEWIRRRTRLYTQADIASLESMISGAGLNARRVLPILLGAKLMIMVLVPGGTILYNLFAHIPLMARVLSLWAGFMIGILGPDIILGFMKRPYVAAMKRGISDALDLLVVCSEAGMGLESGLEQVSREMLHSNRPMALALAGLLDELKVLPDRRQVFENFGMRSGIEGIQRLATILNQSLQYGTPLSQALRSISADLRRDRMVELEEKAAKLPVKLILPLVMFIMPCLFIVLVGGAFLRLFDMLHQMAPH